jgi:uncharacterized membrane protein required for colicin V production
MVGQINGVDLVIIIVVLYQVYWGLRKGVFRIVFDLFAFYIALSVTFSHFLEMRLWLEINLGFQGTFSFVSAFFFAFLFVYFILKGFGVFLNKLINSTPFKGVNVIGGVFLGVLKGLLVVLVMLVPLTQISQFSKNLAPYVNESYIVSNTEVVWAPLLSYLVPENIEKVKAYLEKKTRSED